MFNLFSGGAEDEDGAWPASRIVAALENHYKSPRLLGEDGPLKVYGVEDNGVNFVVALVQSAPGSGKVVELGFLARFVGFAVGVQQVEKINRNLHISVASLEGADLFLMAGLQVTGPYDDGQFALLLSAWRRDLTMTLHGLSGEQASMAAAFPAARLRPALDFAANPAPQAADDRENAGAVSIDMLSSFLGKRAAPQAVCRRCDGRGRRGLIARMCGDCGGTGFVAIERG